MNLSLTRLSSAEADFEQRFTRWLQSNEIAEMDVSATVADIVQNIKKRGDGALLEYTRDFDHLQLETAAELEIASSQLQSALRQISTEERQALEFAQQRIRQYAEKQSITDWSFTDEDGSILGQRVTPIDRVGIYVPGGTAAYPSSVLMNAVPAKVAGVEEIIMVVPTPHGEINMTVLAAACVAGVDRVFRIGGAQAVAALAYGTQTIPRVDKIVGPGNAYVANAKRMVFGQVGIDMIAGPSEVLVIADESANPEWVAMDLFSQAEHDPLARATLISLSAEFTEQVYAAMNKMIDSLARAEIVKSALAQCGALIDVASQDEAVELANRIAPEHLELSVASPDDWIDRIKHAGAIFVGHHSPEVFGDYCAGPNHVLPTATTARFSSPLGVYDFQKRSSVIRCSEQGAAQLSQPAYTLACSEGLGAHAQSARFRGRNEA